MNSALTLLLVFLGVSLTAQADDINVAVAANMSSAMSRIAQRFEQQSKHHVNLVIGSTGQFAAQIRHGAPFDLLVAADDETPAALENEGLAVPGSRRHYASGRLALWSRDAGKVDSAGAVLREGKYERLAVANPRLAPYGAAALETLERLGLRSALQDKMVQGESIGQAYQFVASGNAPLGFVALSQIMIEGKVVRGSAWIVPASLHAPLRQEAVLLLPGRDKPAARALLDFLGDEATRKILTDYGYQL